MSKNRVLYVLIVVPILAVTAMSLRQVMTTKAAGAQGSQLASAAMSAHADALKDRPQADRSYDAVESIRQNRNAPATALQSGKCLDDECSYQLTNGQWVR